jgi:hypothetical protein
MKYFLVGLNPATGSLSWLRWIHLNISGDEYK